MAKKLLFFMLILSYSAHSQEFPRQLLSGQVYADSIEVENITVLNKNSNIHAITNAAGKFTIYAKEKDTLLFSAISLNPRQLVLEKSDFEFNVLKVTLHGNITALDEVVIYRVKLTGDMNADSKRIKTTEFAIPESGTLVDPDYGRGEQLVNIATPTTESSLTGIDFMRIGGTVLGWFVKPKPKKERVEPTMELFADVVQQRFTYHFFTKTLKIDHEKIGLFLSFCDTPEAKLLLNPAKEFELTDYLIKMSTAFHAMNKE